MSFKSEDMVFNGKKKKKRSEAKETPNRFQPHKLPK